MDPCRLQLRFWGPDASPVLDCSFLHSWIQEGHTILNERNRLWVLKKSL